jgi:uncharacterized protein YjiS (DUF1127 family)
MFLVSFLGSLGKAVADWNRRQRAYEELMALDDHCLADLGIERSQINAYLACGRRDAGAPTPAPAPRSALFGRHKPA